MHKITNLCKFELNRSLKLRDINERKKKTPLSHHGHTKLRPFRCLISRPQIPNLRSRNQIRGKLFLSRKLHINFRGSCFSQCFILSAALHCSLPSKFLCYTCNYFESLPIVSLPLKTNFPGDQGSNYRKKYSYYTI